MSLRDQLLGGWQLQKWEIRWSYEEVNSHPMGERAAGLIVYTADGWMSAVIHAPDRSLPADVSPRQMKPEDCARAYTSYMHYAGPYRVEGSDVIHQVQFALNPNMVGTEQIRHIDLRGDQLILRGEEDLGERQRLHQVTWRRQ